MNFVNLNNTKQKTHDIDELNLKTQCSIDTI